MRFIGDKNVRSLDDARRYIEQGPMKMYAERGFGLWLVEGKPDRAPLGICGLVKREQLEDVDLGFAFLPRFRSQGYARESAQGVLDYARASVGLTRVVAITSPDNHASSRLLEKLGFAHQDTLDWGRGDPVSLYSKNSL